MIDCVVNNINNTENDPSNAMSFGQLMKTIFIEYFRFSEHEF